jgi:hypothetical protein
MLEENELNIDTNPLDNFDAGIDVEEIETGVGLEENEQVDLELEDIGEGAFDASQPKGKTNKK